MLDRVTHRTNLRDELITITRMLLKQSPAIKGDLPKPSADETSVKTNSAK
jgi:acetyl-CoA carboxylase carboxyl transferase subunit beta